MSDKIKLGLIGVGHMGQYHVNVATGLTQQYSVIGVQDSSRERAGEIADRFSVPAIDDVDEVIKKSDAVVIAVPTIFHYDIAKKALELGKHVLVEKPMTASVDQARELVAMADKKGVVIQVGHVERFNGAVMELHKIVEKPYLVESRRLSPFSSRIGDVGVVLDLMIHDLDIISNLVGGEIVDVHAEGKKVFSDHEDVASALLQFEGGCVATVAASRATQSKVRTLTVSQEKAYIMLDFATQDIDVHRQASSVSIMYPEELKYKQESFVEKISVHKDNPLRQEHLHFIGCIRKEETPHVSGESDIRTLEVAHDILTQVQNTMR